MDVVDSEVILLIVSHEETFQGEQTQLVRLPWVTKMLDVTRNRKQLRRVELVGGGLQNELVGVLKGTGVLLAEGQSTQDAVLRVFADALKGEVTCATSELLLSIEVEVKLNKS